MVYEIFSNDGMSYGLYEGASAYEAFVKFVEDAGYSKEEIGEWPVGSIDDYVIVEVDTSTDEWIVS